MPLAPIEVTVRTTDDGRVYLRVADEAAAYASVTLSVEHAREAAEKLAAAVSSLSSDD